jgi:formylglycine-generating enzyme required for sulfatase activity/serine/threonine protein kinase
MIEANTLLQNRYEIIRPIGQGGMGTVYLAKDHRLGNTVALKESIFTDEKMVAAFEHEARLLAGLRHSALPKVSDHFSEGESKFLVMEYIGGNDLGEILDKRKLRLEPIGKAKPFEPDEVLGWAEQLLDALDYLHTRQSPIIHRDIKPQNLKLAERNQIILLDFGLAKGSAFQMTRAATSKSIFGYTPAYAPIEQIQGSGTDPRSDLYSLAATLYHLATGIEPPDALQRANAFLGGEKDPLQPANEINPKINGKVAEVFSLAMSQHRNLRPESAKAMLKLLRDAKNATNLAGQKTVAEAPTVRVSQPESIKPTVPYQATPSPSQSDPYSQPNSQNNPYSQPNSQPNAYPPPNYQSDPYAGQQYQGNHYPPHPSQGGGYPPQPPMTVAGRTDTNPNPPAPFMTSQPSMYAQQQPVMEKRGGGKIWLGVFFVVVVLSGFVVAAVYYYQESNRSTPSTPPNRNPQVVNPPENIANKNTANSNTAPLVDDKLEVIKGLTSAQNYARIPAGEFSMGSEDHGDTADVPHLVKITRPFEMAKYETTQAQWEALMGNNPSNFKGDNHPVENVSWEEAQEFIDALNALKDGYIYRLPTEAEWEYAARSGGKGEDQYDIDSIAWTGDNSGLKSLDTTSIFKEDQQNYRKRILANGNQPHPVGQKKPNKWGLYDMQGNVWEWCQDWYNPSYYLDSPEANPRGPESGTQKINRGGSWYSRPDICQTTNRSKDEPNKKLFHLGFRIVRNRQ